MSTTLPAAAGTYLVFGLGETEYAIDVAGVREIIGALPITRVPGMPAAVRGVINLRGKVIPVIDLRLRFGLDAVDHGQRTCVVVVHTGQALLGLVVDRVLEVARIGDDQIEPAPPVTVAAGADYLLGIAQHGARVRLLLDLACALPAADMASLAAAVPADA
jgi:purine-binding chemotaxis protein CheW